MDVERIIKTGSIEVVTGPMFAGKSEELIRRIKRLEYAKKNVLVFKPEIDNRYSDSDVVSHAKNKAKCINIRVSNDVLKYIKSDTHAVVIDEVQFLDIAILDVVDILANRGIRVIVGGLDTDFKCQPFDITAKMLAKAEYITKLTAVCVVCGEPATLTQRIVDGIPASIHDDIVLVGASEAYEPRCRHCHQLRR